MILIPLLDPKPRLSDDDYPGVGIGWWFWSEVVLIRCENNDVLWLPHAIATDGTVTPSLVCSVPNCGWHVWARLENWTLGDRQKQDPLTAAKQKAKDLGYALEGP